MGTKGIMNTLRLVAPAVAVLFTSWCPGYCQGNPSASIPPPSRTIPRSPAAEESVSKETVNYVIRVDWKDSKNAAHHLEVLTTEGTVNLDTFLQDKVKIDDSEIPVTISLKGSLSVLSPEKGRLSLFLGRTVPYVTGSNIGPGGKTSSYQQRQVGLSSTFIVTFGKPVVIQSDENEKVSILVKRAED